MGTLTRAATPADDAAVAVLVERLLGERATDPGGLVELVAETRDRGVLLVVEDDSGLAGFAGASLRQGIALELGLYLEPECRGMGLRLLGELEWACMVAGCWMLRSTPATGRERVAALYRRRGYEWDGVGFSRLLDPLVV